MSYKILGIDPSTKMGLVLLKYSDDTVKTMVAEEYKSKQKGIERLADIGQRINEALEQYRPDAVWIEGYSFMSKFNLVTMAEIGTVIRFFLWQEGYTINEVAPTSLKKFVSGKGNCKKDVMLLQAYKNWGFSTHNDNVADAYSIAMYGLLIHLKLVDVKGCWKKGDTTHLKYKHPNF